MRHATSSIYAALSAVVSPLNDMPRDDFDEQHFLVIWSYAYALLGRRRRHSASTPQPSCESTKMARRVFDALHRFYEAINRRCVRIS